jgi:hypothetical protein
VSVSCTTTKSEAKLTQVDAGDVDGVHAALQMHAWASHRTRRSCLHDLRFDVVSDRAFRLVGHEDDPACTCGRTMAELGCIFDVTSAN